MLEKSGKGYKLDDREANRILYDENGYIEPKAEKKNNLYYYQTRKGKRVRVKKNRK